MRYIVAVAFLFALAFVIRPGLPLGGPVAAVPPLPDGRLIVMAEGLSLDAPSVTTGFLETDDCRSFVVFVDATTALNVFLHPSPDGVLDPARLGGSKFSRVAGRSATFFSLFIAAPLLAIEFERVGGTSSDTITQAWLFCTH